MSDERGGQEKGTLETAKDLVAGAVQRLGLAAPAAWRESQGTITPWEYTEVDVGAYRLLKVGVSSGGVVSFEGDPFTPGDRKVNTTAANVERSLVRAVVALQRGFGGRQVTVYEPANSFSAASQYKLLQEYGFEPTWDNRVNERHTAFAIKLPEGELRALRMLQRAQPDRWGPLPEDLVKSAAGAEGMGRMDNTVKQAAPAADIAEQRRETMKLLQEEANAWVEKAAPRSALIGERNIVVDRHQRTLGFIFDEGGRRPKLELPEPTLEGVSLFTAQGAEAWKRELELQLPESGPFTVVDFADFANKRASELRQAIGYLERAAAEQSAVQDAREAGGLGALRDEIEAKLKEMGYEVVFDLAAEPEGRQRLYRMNGAGDYEQASLETELLRGLQRAQEPRLHPGDKELGECLEALLGKAAFGDGEEARAADAALKNFRGTYLGLGPDLSAAIGFDVRTGTGAASIVNDRDLHSSVKSIMLKALQEHLHVHSLPQTKEVIPEQEMVKLVLEWSETMDKLSAQPGFADREIARAWRSRVELESGLEREDAHALADKLRVLAAEHVKVCAMGVEEPGSSARAAERRAIEERVQEAVSGAPGILGVRFSGDPRGSTIRLKFESGASDSMAGDWKVPVLSSSLTAAEAVKSGGSLAVAPDEIGYAPHNPRAVVPADTAQAWKDAGASASDLEAIAKAGGYPALLDDDKKTEDLQDILDSCLHARLIAVRTHLREMGWTGEQYGELRTEAPHMTLALDHRLRQVGAGRNIVGIEYVVLDASQQESYRRSEPIVRMKEAMGEPAEIMAALLQVELTCKLLDRGASMAKAVRSDDPEP